MADFDVIVVGAGPGGYVCAIRAAQLGLKTAIVERRFLGGICLNVGCIPSKALLRNAEVAHLLRERGKEFGFQVEGLKLDYAAAVKRSRQVSNRLTRGVGFLMKKNSIEVFMGTARFSGAKELTVTGESGEPQILRGENIVIATGASASMIPGVKPDGERVLTYLEAILQERLPKSAVIIGAGPIGLEFATVWNAYGSEVTVVEMLPRIAPLEDEEVSNELAKAFKKSGIAMELGAKCTAIEETGENAKFPVKSIEVLTALEGAETEIVRLQGKERRAGQFHKA